MHVIVLKRDCIYLQDRRTQSGLTLAIDAFNKAAGSWQTCLFLFVSLHLPGLWLIISCILSCRIAQSSFLYFLKIIRNRIMLLYKLYDVISYESVKCPRPNFNWTNIDLPSNLKQWRIPYSACNRTILDCKSTFKVGAAFKVCSVIKGRARN